MFPYSPLSKAVGKQIKAIKYQGIKQIEALKALKPEENQELESIERSFPKKIRTNETKNENAKKIMNISTCGEDISKKAQESQSSSKQQTITVV